MKYEELSKTTLQTLCQSCDIMCDAHLQRSLLDGDLAVDSSTVVRTNRLQLVFVEREELGAGQDAEAGDGAAEGTTNNTPLSQWNISHGLEAGHMC